MTTIDEVLDAEDKLQYLKEKYLRERGWKLTSQTPSFIWMWEKKIEDGRTLLVSCSTALRIEEMRETMA